MGQMFLLGYNYGELKLLLKLFIFKFNLILTFLIIGFRSIDSNHLISCSILDDITNIFTNFTKFGLGFVSILFDILFMVQHYILYRDHQELDLSGLTHNRVRKSYKTF